MNSPREKSRNGNDCRGNYASHGHLYFSEKLARQYIAGVKQPQFYRLRWRKNPLPPKKRIANKVKRFKRIKEVINELAE